MDFKELTPVKVDLIPSANFGSVPVEPMRLVMTEGFNKLRPYLELGLIPYALDPKKMESEEYPQCFQWTENEDLAEELLMMADKYAKGRDSEKEDSFEVTKQKVEETIKQVDEKLAYMIRTYVEMVGYDRILCKPIIEKNNAFLSQLEETSELEIAFLQSIKHSLDSIISVLFDIKEALQRR